MDRIAKHGIALHEEEMKTHIAQWKFCNSRTITQSFKLNSPWNICMQNLPLRSSVEQPRARFRSTELNNINDSIPPPKMIALKRN